MKICGANRLMGIAGGRFDGHAHVFGFPNKLSERRKYTPIEAAPIQTYCNHLLENDLNGGILVQPSFLGTDNSALLEALKLARPSENLTMRGVVVVDADISSEKLLEFKQAGIIGVRLNLVSGEHSTDFEVEQWFSLFQKLNDMGLHLEIYEYGRKLAKLLPILLARVEKIVVDHFGMPDPTLGPKDPAQKLIRQIDTGQVFVKTSAPYRLFKDMPSNQAAARCIPIYQWLFESIGAEQLIWASDWPWTRFESKHEFRDTLEWLDLWNASLDQPIAVCG